MATGSDRARVGARRASGARLTAPQCSHVSTEEHVRRLEDLAALKADFTAMVAHELDAPIAAARALTAMLRTGALAPASQSHALETIAAELDRLGALVRDLRQAATSERDDYAIQLHPVPARTLLDDAIAFAKTVAGQHLVTETHDATAAVSADPLRIGQVFRNLLTNAANFSPAGTPIEIRSRLSPGHVRFDVCDHGPGVAPGDLPRIFEKYGRGRGEAGRRGDGLGLGLYVSRRIVRAHGSDLIVSPTPGGGATFWFELERAE